MPHTVLDVTAPDVDLDDQAALVSADAPSDVEVEPTLQIEMPDGPPLLSAAGIAGYLLRAARVSTWEQLAAALDSGDLEVATRLAPYHLTNPQLRLLDGFTDEIGLISVDPPRTIAACDTCGQWMLVGARSVPSGCHLTLGCGGKVVRAPRGRRIKRDDPGRSVDRPAEEPNPAGAPEVEMRQAGRMTPSSEPMVVEEAFGQTPDPEPEDRSTDVESSDEPHDDLDGGEQAVPGDFPL